MLLNGLSVLFWTYLTVGLLEGYGCIIFGILGGREALGLDVVDILPS